MSLGIRQNNWSIFINYEGIKINEILHNLEIEIKIRIDDRNTT